MIWYNPPFSLNVKTNVGKIFFKLLNKHFPKTNPLIVQKNMVKISYSCMKNVSSIISHKNILNEENKIYGCNCRNRNSCPLHGKCKTPSIIYMAEITNDKDQEKKRYILALKPLSRTVTITIQILLDTESMLHQPSCLNMFGY